MNFLSPIERHDGLDKEVLEKYFAVYETAKSNPEQWTKTIRRWPLEDKVLLNSELVARNVDIVENETLASLK